MFMAGRRIAAKKRSKLCSGDRIGARMKNWITIFWHWNLLCEPRQPAAAAAALTRESKCLPVITAAGIWNFIAFRNTFLCVQMELNVGTRPILVYGARSMGRPPIRCIAARRETKKSISFLLFALTHEIPQRVPIMPNESVFMSFFDTIQREQWWRKIDTVRLPQRQYALL